MSRSAKNLLAMSLSEGWSPKSGKPFRQTDTFRQFSELCGCNTDGKAIPGAKSQVSLGETADGFSIRDLAENLIVNRTDGQPVGRSFINEFFDPNRPTMLYESGAISAVDTTAFTGITGQLMVTEVLKPFDYEEFAIRKLIPTYNSPFEQEKWIGIGRPADPGKNILRVQEGEEYRMVGMGEEYVQTSPTRKEGLIIGLTKEAVFYDRTGQLVERASQVGYQLALSEEKECIGVLIGGTTDPTYFVEKRAGDSAPVTLDMYQYSASGSGAYQLAYAHASRPYPFYNDITDNPLVDYTSIRLCDQAFGDIVDPNTGEPIVIGKPYVIAPFSKRIDILQMLQAENIWKLSQSGWTSAGAINTTTKNADVLGRIGMTADQFVASRQLKAQLVAQLGLSSALADLAWFYGDPGQAFKYVSNWPAQVTVAPANSEAEFMQDVVVRFKASKRGRACIANARAMLRCNVTGTVGSSD